MTEKVSIIYTIAKCDPRTVDDPDVKVSDIKDYFGLINRLNPDNEFKFKNILLGMARRLNGASGSNTYDKFTGEIKSLFVSDYEAIDDKDTLYIVERGMVGEDVLIDPLDAWTMDVRVFKAILTRSLYLSRMDEKDMFRIELMYKLHRYPSWIRMGGVDSSETMEYTRRYNSYLFEFYRRSQNPKRKVWVEYLRKARRANELFTYNQGNITNRFDFEVSAVGTLKQVEQNIREFSDDLVFYAERMYQTYFAEDQYKAQRSGGNGAPEAQFRMWDRYIRIYDLYKEYLDKNKEITEGVLNAICFKIQKEFNFYTTSEPRKLRKEIKQGYSEALRLIEESTKGYLS